MRTSLATHSPEENFFRILRIAKEQARVFPNLPQDVLEDVVKEVCWRELGPPGYNSAVVSRAVSAAVAAIHPPEAV